MCDYSLMEFPNRLATEGEVLLVHRFRSGSLGLASPGECNPPRPFQSTTFWGKLKEILFLPEPPQPCAVCIPPGARLILHEMPPAMQKQLAVGPREEVTFVQLSATENQHRDAVRFRTGKVLRLQELTMGQRVEVVDLGNSDREEPAGNFETTPAEPVGDWRR